MKIIENDPEADAITLAKHILKRQNKKFYSFAAHNSARLCLDQKQDSGYVTVTRARDLFRHSSRRDLYAKWFE